MLHCLIRKERYSEELWGLVLDVCFLKISTGGDYPTPKGKTSQCQESRNEQVHVLQSSIPAVMLGRVNTTVQCITSTPLSRVWT